MNNLISQDQVITPMPSLGWILGWILWARLLCLQWDLLQGPNIRHLGLPCPQQTHVMGRRHEENEFNRYFGVERPGFGSWSPHLLTELGDLFSTYLVPSEDRPGHRQQAHQSRRACSLPSHVSSTDLSRVRTVPSASPQ